MRYLKLQDVCATLGVDDDFLGRMVSEGLVVVSTIDNDLVISVQDAERLRVGVLLLREMDVNWEGMEVILHMREEAVAMQHQFSEILAALAEELRKRLE